MIKLLFVCHGNICRSPMAEFIMKDLVRQRSLEEQFEIASAATTDEEPGNPVYPPVRELLRQRGLSCKGKTARQLRSSDYDRYDLFVGMDEENRRVLKDGEPLELTEKEFAILLFLANHRGHVVAVEQIYEGVWHEKYMPASNNTVMVHIVNLRKKLEEDPTNPRLIRTVWGKGYQVD